MSTPTASFEAGDLRRRVAIQQLSETPNSSGGATATWVTLTGCASVPARMTYPTPSKKGDEQISQQQIRSSAFITVTIRFRPSQNISAAMRILYGTRVFNIRTVLPVDEYRQEITLQCEEQQASGTIH